MKITIIAILLISCLATVKAVHACILVQVISSGIQGSPKCTGTCSTGYCVLKQVQNGGSTSLTCDCAGGVGKRK
jgi:hypothetical protein